MNNLKENKPTADVLMNSMRAMGYSFESAIADIVDNSISAKSTLIALQFPVDPAECYVAICDNGCGMTNDELFDAMKYGSEKKREGRAEDDLGRFGLGLKSASLSQCRKLTVVSKKEGRLSAYIWDLDIVEQKKGWYVVECSESQIPQIRFASFLDNYESGTVVLWENFDFIEKATGNIYSELNKYKESVTNYLELIFHRYINGEAAVKPVIQVNNYTLSGLDPFLENHKKTNNRRKIEIAIPDSKGVERMISVQPYVLPFQKDLSAEDKRLSGGIENYRSKQGFYVYRNKRLIIWGTWFGRHRDELTKYARIKVDIPNTLDDIWGIDIKKQNAKIPLIIKNRLTRAVDEAMDIAVRAQTYRGRLANNDEKIDYIWNRVKGRGENNYTYEINKKSRIFDMVKQTVDDATWARFEMILEEIERTLPYQQIYIDKSQNRIEEGQDDTREAEVEEKAKVLILMSKAAGTSEKDCIEILFQSEPFCNYPKLKEKFLEEIKQNEC